MGYKFWVRVSVISLLLLGGMVIHAQDDAESSDSSETPVDILECAEGGCTAQESPLTQEEAEIIFGPAPDTDHDPYVACVGNECTWSSIPQDDADTAFGGDGEPDREMTFDEDEVSDDADSDDGATDEMTFTEDEVEDYLNDLCSAEECRSVTFDGDDFNALFDDSPDEAGIQPEDGLWTTQLGTIVSSCPGGNQSLPMEQTTQELTFSDPFVVTDVMDLSGGGSGISYSNQPSTNTYIAHLDMGDSSGSASVRYAYRVISEEEIRGNMLFQINVEGFACAATMDFKTVREGDTESD